SKADVRAVSAHLGLPTWDKPSFACLSSRFPYGTAITRENLDRVDRAETFLRDHGFRSFRVRYHDASTARIEIAPADIARMLDDGIRSATVAHMKGLGFTYVTLDLQGYRTGSMNEVLTSEVRERYAAGG
ncbi:MAG TPA: TIGR00268 family protein, partial [Bacteroidota bacterium]|nr:TIGR00268 family protein [Bacteroidota bacterium]